MKLFIQLLVLVIVVCIGQFVIYKITDQAIPEIATLNSILRQPGPIIEFSDSVAHNASSYDTDTRTISEMIDAIQPDLNVQLLWHSSYTLAVFDSYVTYIARSKSKPRAIIVPVNLDDVSPLYEKYPGQLFERLNFLLTTRIPFADIFVQPLAVFNVINLSTISPQAWLAEKVYDWDVPFGTVQDCYDLGKVSQQTPDILRQAYICEYLTKASLDHVNMKALAHLIDSAKQAHIPLLVVVTPVDVEGGTRFVGPSFKDDIASNAAFVCNLAITQGVPCTDLSNAVSDTHFDAHTSPTPHLDQYGRLQVATSIAAALKDLLRTSTTTKSMQE